MGWSVFDITLLESRDGFISCLVEGDNVDIFKHECGSHVFQRVGPTEKRGRVHTSLITVAVLPVPEEKDIIIKDSDLEISSFCSSSAGGQNVQKNETAIRVVHKPTGLVAVCQNERSQYQNKLFALSVIRARLKDLSNQTSSDILNDKRYNQIGYGGRGDKVRTIRVKDNLVLCHVTNRSKSLKEYTKGRISFV